MPVSTGIKPKKESTGTSQVEKPADAASRNISHTVSALRRDTRFASAGITGHPIVVSGDRYKETHNTFTCFVPEDKIEDALLAVETALAKFSVKASVECDREVDGKPTKDAMFWFRLKGSKMWEL